MLDGLQNNWPELLVVLIPAAIGLSALWWYRHSNRTSLLAVVVGFTCLAAAVLGGALWATGVLQAVLGNLDLTQADAVWKVTQSVTLTFGALGVVAASIIIINYRQRSQIHQVQAAQDQVAAARKQLEQDRRKNQLELEKVTEEQIREIELGRQERYAQGAQMLAAESPTVRIAGLNVIAILGREVAPMDELRQTCVNLVCAYLRASSPATPHTTPNGKHQEDGEPERPAPAPNDAYQVVAVEACRLLPTLLEEVAPSDHSDAPPHGLDLDLRQVNLIDLNLGRRHVGAVSCKRATFNGPADFRGATFNGDAEFAGATFSGDAEFAGATFSGDAVFAGATFSRKVEFGEATFSQDAVFLEATFSWNADFQNATFTENASFWGATFTELAVFAGATFSRNAEFAGATFSRDAVFGDATFTGDAEFGEATFRQDAVFYRATFMGHAEFAGATFTGTAWFERATVTGHAEFRRSTFTGDAKFGRSTFTGDAEFAGARFVRYGGRDALVPANFLASEPFQGAVFGPEQPSDADLTIADLRPPRRQHPALPARVRPPVGSQLVVGLYTDVGGQVDPRVIVDLVRAVGVLAALAVSVGPRLGPNAGPEGAGSTALLTTTTAGEGPAVLLSSLEYRNPFSAELVELLKVAAPLTVFGATGGRLIIKDLLKGADKSGLVSVIATLMSPEERAEFVKGRVTRRRRRRLEDEAAIAEAKAKIQDAEPAKMTVAAATEKQLADRIRASVDDGAAADELVAHLSELDPITSRPYAVSVEGDPGAY